MTYSELQVTTHFSFLRGASSAEELFSTAALMGMPALGVVDRNSVAGLVRSLVAAETVSAQHAPIRLVVGCRLDLVSGASVLVWLEDRAAWTRLTRLLTRGNQRADAQRGEKGHCFLHWDDLRIMPGAWSARSCPDQMARTRPSSPGCATFSGASGAMSASLIGVDRVIREGWPGSPPPPESTG